MPVEKLGTCGVGHGSHPPFLREIGFRGDLFLAPVVRTTIPVVHMISKNIRGVRTLV
jgi:hypothetical protein